MKARMGFRLLSTVVVLWAACGSARADLLALYEGNVVNGPASQVILDSSGNGNHAVFLGDGRIEDGAGVVGGALDFPDTAPTTARVNPAGAGAFDSISDEQAFTVAFWMAGEESAVAPRNQSVFWAVGIDGETDRAFQSHAPWSNSNVYLDIGGCCDADTQRVNGEVDREFWDAATGEEWTHYAYTLDPEFGDARVYIDGELVFERQPSAGTSFVPELQSFWIGSAPNAGNRFSGRLDDFFLTDNPLSEEDINAVISDGAKAFFGTDDPAEYTPMGADLNLVDLNDAPNELTLGGHASVDGGVESWFVEQLFRTNAAGQEVVATADLSVAGVAGTENIGGPGDDVALGTVNLMNDGADDMTVEFRINAVAAGDPILGLGATSFTQTFTLAGSGGGGPIDPFVLMGDLTQDGIINFSDFLIFSANFGATQGGAPQATIPEPSSAVMLLLGALVMLRGRRR